MHIGENVFVDVDTWELANQKKEDSKFVKDVAVIIWGREGLQNKCLDQRRANRNATENEIRQILLPSKYTD